MKHRLVAQAMAVLMAAGSVSVLGITPAAAQDWTVEGENNPSTFDCDSLYYSNFRSGAKFNNGPDGKATIENTVITKRTAGSPRDYWSSNMAMGKDPDTDAVTAFYANYTTANLRLYKHVSGTNTVTDEIFNGETRDLPAGTNWGGITVNPSNYKLYGAQNGGTPKLFEMDLKTGAVKEWERGKNLTSVPANDPIFAGGSLVPDLFVDNKGGVYYGIVYGGKTHIYRLNPANGTTTRALTIIGPGSSNGFDNYGLAYHKGYIYLGYLGGKLYRADAATGVSEEVPGGNAQANQVGRIETESGGGWPITDLASCDIAPDLTARLKLRKTASSSVVKAGDTITYTIEATNDGAATATGVTLTDDLTDVLDDTAYNNDAHATRSSGAAATAPAFDSVDKKLTWTGDIPAGEKVTLTYTVKVNKPLTGDKKLTNAITGPDGSTCPPGSTDPECISEVKVQQMKISKTSTPATVHPGEDITYTVRITNTGETDITNPAADDDLSQVLANATDNRDATADRGTVRVVGSTLVWSDGTSLKKGESATITYSVKVNADAAGKKLKNAVTSVTPGAECEDGTDLPCETETEVPKRKLVIAKTSTPASVAPNGRVTYTVRVTNRGDRPVTDANITDDLSEVLENATYNGDATADRGTVSVSGDELVWNDAAGRPLAPGASATITYSVTAKANALGKKLKNAVTTTTPGGECEDEKPLPCETETEVTPNKLVIAKTSAPQSVAPGGKVTYTVRITNSGRNAITGANATDDLTQVLENADYNGDVRADRGTVQVQGNRLVWTDAAGRPLAPGATATITYSVKAKASAVGKKLVNAVTTTTPGASCEDEKPLPCQTETEITPPPPTNKPGKLTVNKKDDKGRPLAGAVFQLWRETNGQAGRQNSDTRVGSACATGQAGVCVFSPLSYATYYVQETAVPDGFVLPRPNTFGPYNVTRSSTNVTTTLVNKRGEICKGKKCK
ncbi:SpaA isopeptide-forming pilin-related protein [Streptomyces sp. NPDC048442]|uniref:DUF7927 domain-containing protein n=1 Tax=Streptomyces sp. NPDC048442 TaxID=3154823 RepID=UPI003440E69A